MTARSTTIQRLATRESFQRGKRGQGTDCLRLDMTCDQKTSARSPLGAGNSDWTSTAGLSSYIRINRTLTGRVYDKVCTIIETDRQR